jgi:ABC-type transport system involved in cytochrome bd biosynthesis fused ATPase/permease subunit
MKSGQLRLLLAKGGSRSLFLSIAIASAISTSLVIALAILIARIIVALVEGTGEVMPDIYLVAALWAFRAVFQSQYEAFTLIKALQIKATLRNEVTTALPNFHSTSAAALSNLLIKGFNSLDTYLGRFLPQLISATITPIAVIITISIFDFTSAVIAVLTLPLIPFFGALIGKYTADSVARKWSSLGTLSKYFEDSLKGFVTLRIYGRHKSQSKRIEEMGDQYTTETMKVLRISFLSAFALELCATISVALIAVAIGLRLVDGQITFVAGLTVLLLAPEVYFPLRNAASLFHASADGKAALGEIQILLDSVVLPVAQVSLDFSKFTSLSWGRWILDIQGVAKSQLSADEISRGQVLFITGESGVGKTTFAKNLLGMGRDGKFTIDGQIQIGPELTNSWQQVIGWIPQNPHFVTGSIADQFRTKSAEIGDQEISELLLRVGLDVIDLPLGLNTQIGGVGEKSAAVSGGQLRKISIARALQGNPALIIADEPSADLDEASTRVIMKELRRVVRDGAALICITHDTAMIHDDDRTISIIRTAEDELARS